MSMNGTYKIYKDGKLVAEKQNKLTVLGRANALKAMLGQNQHFANSFGIGVSSKPNPSDNFLELIDLYFTVGKYDISASSLGTIPSSSTDGLVYVARITDTSRYNINEIGLFSDVLKEDMSVDDLTIFNFQDGDPIKETPLTFTGVTIASNTITKNAHGLSDNNIIKFSGTLATGLVAGTDYYVINSTTNTFQVSSTYKGTALTIGTGTWAAINIVPSDVYFSESSFTTYRSSSLVQDKANYRIGTDAIKITGSGLEKKVFFDETSMDFSDLSPSDMFVLAGYNSSASTIITKIRFYSTSSNYAEYSFSFAPTSYNTINQAKSSAGGSNPDLVDWSSIYKIEIIVPSTLTSPNSLIFDGLKVKLYKPIDASNGLLSRAVLDSPIEKESGSVIDIQYILSMGLTT